MSKAIETAFAKIAVAFVAVAMVIALFAPAAQAQTVEELQAMINDLLAQVASLQGGGDAMSMAAGMCPGTVWTRSLSEGDSGADVMKLQQFLNADPETRVAASGIGSAGQETDYYGGLTGAAVAKFQTKYRAEILDPLGLVSATTFFGPSTMAQANALCAAASDDMMDDDMMDGDDDMMDEDEDEDEDSDNGPLSGDEAELEDFELKDGDDTELQEGQENAPVADAEFDVEDGDIEIERMDVAVDYTSASQNNGDNEPWDVFETISLWVDGDMIAEMDVDDEDEWEEDEPATGDFRVRFTGLDQVFRDGDNAMITVGVSVQSNVEDADDGEEWELFIPTDGIRGRDGADVDQFIGDTTDTVTIDIEEEGSDDELTVKASTNDPDSTTLQLEDDEKSDWLTVFVFDLDSDDSTNDIEVEELRVDVDAEGPDGSDKITSDFVNDVRLVVDGETFDDVTIAHGTTTGTFTFDFDNEEFMIDAGDRQEVEFQIEFVAMSSTTLEGSTIVADVDGSNIDAEGADDLSGSNAPDGSATGEEHTLRTTGAILDLVSTDETFVENSDTSTDDNEGIFELVFDVTAFEQDVFIESNEPTIGTTESDTGVNYLVTSGGTATTGLSVSANLDSDADEQTSGDGTFFRVNEGGTERFTLTVDFDPSDTGSGDFFKVELYSVNFSETAANATVQQLAIPSSDFDTDAISI